MSKKYEILNNSGLQPSGQIGPIWSAYSIDESLPLKPIALVSTATAASESLNDQLDAIGLLAEAIIAQDRTALLSDILITGEYLTISPGTRSVVKNYFLSLIKE